MRTCIRAVVCLTVIASGFVCVSGQVSGQSRDPRIGYIYPAGLQRGTAAELTVGGQYLDGATEAVLSRSSHGIRVTVLEHKKPPSQQQINEFREKFLEVQRAVQADPKPRGAPEAFQRIAREMGHDPDQLMEFDEIRRRINDPKRQPNPQIGETVRLRVECEPDTPIGQHELRLVATGGLSNPLRFHVGAYHEHYEREPNDAVADPVGLSLPVTINGQIPPGDVDRFRFEATAGTRLVASVSARDLMPYLADAVPGWFQAVLTLHDDQGNELAHADDFRLQPDPVLFYEIPSDGAYVLEIHDAVYRGREDFVYRITLGAIPFVTDVFPLGGPADTDTEVHLTGWNLTADRLTLTPDDKKLGERWIAIGADEQESKRAPFAVERLPNMREVDANNTTATAQTIELPVIVNGRIDAPGDVHDFDFEGRAGERVVAEVVARRLGSRLDSVLTLHGPDGTVLAMNDDHDDPTAGLLTHQADSLILATLPRDGVYRLRIGDAQGLGGPRHAYRLRVGPPRPSFDLCVTPSGVNLRSGTSTPITLHAARRDGFTGPIEVRLNNAPPGFVLSGGRIPEGKSVIRATLTAPARAMPEPLDLELVATAMVDQAEITRSVIPADEMMQAFFHQHLVPASRWMVTVTGFNRPLVTRVGETVRIPVGWTARVEFQTAARQPLVGPDAANPYRFELNQGPEGVALVDAVAEPRGFAITLRAADDVESGLADNLIIDVYTERVVRLPDGTPTANVQRTLVGTLPAVPFEVVKSD